MYHRQKPYSKEAVGKKRKTRKIVIIGPAKCGKSALVERFLDNSFTDIPHNHKVKRANRDYKYRGYYLNIDIIVLSARDEVEKKTFHITTADAIMLVYEFANLESVNQVIQCYASMRKLREDKMPVILIGTKTDKHSGSSPRMKSEDSDDINSLLDKIRGVKKVYISAKYNIHIRDTFELCFDDLIKGMHTWSMSEQLHEAKFLGDRSDRSDRRPMVHSERQPSKTLVQRFFPLCYMRSHDELI